MEEKNLVPEEIIESEILLIRGKKVMLDRDLATLYVVTTGNLNRAVRRNLDRFPENFMFQLTNQEVKNLIFQFGTSKTSGELVTIYDRFQRLKHSSVLNRTQSVLEVKNCDLQRQTK